MLLTVLVVLLSVDMCVAITSLPATVAVPSVVATTPVGDSVGGGSCGDGSCGEGSRWDEASFECGYTGHQISITTLSVTGGNTSATPSGNCFFGTLHAVRTCLSRLPLVEKVLPQYIHCVGFLGLSLATGAILQLVVPAWCRLSRYGYLKHLPQSSHVLSAIRRNVKYNLYVELHLTKMSRKLDTNVRTRHM